MAETKTKTVTRKTSAPKSTAPKAAGSGTRKRTAAPKPGTGIYINRRPETAFFTFLMPDGTCGMFLMTSAQNVFYLGFTKYKLSGDKLQFKIQNPNGPVDPSKPLPKVPKVKKPAGMTASAAAKIAEELYIEATLTPGKGYIQHGKKEDAVFDFLTPDTKYWEKTGFKKIGKARLLDDKADFDIAHEIKKLCILSIQIYGNEFIWA